MKHTVTEHKLAGGAKGLVVHVSDSPVISFEVRFNSGYEFVERAKFELPHVAEHLMHNVSRPSYPEHSSIVIALGVNGAYSNAHTNGTTNGYVFEFAAFELERILGIFDEYLTQPQFNQIALETEVSNVREELSRNTTNYARISFLALREQSFPRHAMNDPDRISLLPSLTLTDVNDFYHRTHIQGNARLYLAGDFPDGGKAAIESLGKIVTKLPKGNRFEADRAMGKNVPKPIWQAHDIKQLYYYLDVYFGEVPVEDRPALALLRTLLVGGYPARIFGEARRRGLAYHVAGSAGSSLGNSLFGLSGYVTPDNAHELFKLFTREVLRLRKGELGEAELTAAKDRVIGSVIRSNQRASDYLDWYIEAYDDEERILDFDAYLESLRQVSVEKVIELARLVSSEKRHGVSFVGPVDEKLAGEYARILEPIWSLT